MNPRQQPPVQYCPYCDHVITPAEINISEGVALCGDCGTLSKLSELNFSGATIEETLSKVPRQITLRPGYKNLEIVISLFSFPKFLGSLAITLFWNGIVSIFLSLAAAAVWYQIAGPVPDWFPVPGLEEGKPIMNDQVMGPGMTLFLCLFLTPFVFVGTGMLINTLLYFAGSTRILIDPNRSFVATGISFLRLKRSFDPLAVKSVERVTSKLQQQGQHNTLIAIESSKTVKFGRMLDESQQQWVLALLKEIFLHRGGKRSDLVPSLPWLDHR